MRKRIKNGHAEKIVCDSGAKTSTKLERSYQRKKMKPHNFKVNDMVLVKDPDAAVFEPRYQPNFRVTAIFGNNRKEVQDETRTQVHKKISPCQIH